MWHGLLDALFDFLPALLIGDAVRAEFSAPERTAEVWACMHLGICLAVTDMAATGAGAETSDDEIGTVGTRSSSSIRSVSGFIGVSPGLSLPDCESVC